MHKHIKETNFFKQLCNGIISFVLPNICICCEQPLEKNSSFVCNDCIAKLKKVDAGYNIWGDRVHSVSFGGNAFSLFWFVEGTEIQQLLHALKYSRMKSIGTLFGKMLGEEITLRYGGHYDFAVPVPLHKSRLRERTYNQSSYICRGIGEALGIQPLDKCLERTRYTRTQTKLSINEREENVRNAFELNPKFSSLVMGKNIVLVDDVITTGSTILECARVLESSGCGEITICSIALAE